MTDRSQRKAAAAASEITQVLEQRREQGIAAIPAVARESAAIARRAGLPREVVEKSVQTFVEQVTGEQLFQTQQAHELGAPADLQHNAGVLGEVVAMLPAIVETAIEAAGHVGRLSSLLKRCRSCR